MLHLFGSARHETLGRLDTKKPTALLIYLAASGTWIDRTALATLIWGEASEANAKSSLRQALYVLNKTWSEQLELDANRVRLNVDTDLKAFKAALERDDLELVTRLGEAAFLEAYVTGIEAFDDWVALERQTLSEVWRDAALRFARQVSDVRSADLFKLLLAVLEREPLAEEVVQELLRFTSQGAFYDEALKSYQRFAARLKLELDLEPLDETKSLLERLRQKTKGLKEGVTLKRKPLTPFVGRDLELSELINMLERSSPLVTLLGQGGVGKTRLALQLLSLKQPVFKDGAVFVDLSSVDSKEAMTYATTQALGLLLKGSESPLEQLCAYLKNKEMLLVLDNFEHLTKHAELLMHWLANAPKVKILVTSRNKLNLSIEQVFALEGLAHPQDFSDEAFASSDAVQFFLRTIKRLDPSFRFDTQDRVAVLRICQHLEGLPLGLELSASWLAMMTLREIERELAHSFDLLESPNQDVPERQQSLAAVFEYSWRLLSVSEQVALAALSVFVGGFDQQAIRNVTGASRQHLLSLINKSLVQRTRPSYFDLHALVKHYAATKLSLETKATLETKHKAYFLQRLLENAENLKASLVQEALDDIANHLTNIQKAYQLALVTLEPSVLLKATWALRRFYELRARFSEGIYFFETTLSLCDTAAQKAVLLAVQAWLVQCAGRYPEAVLLAEESLAQPELADSIRLEALQALGASQMRLGNFEAAKEAYQAGFKLAGKLDNRSAEASLGSNLGLLYQRLADYEQALQYMQASLASFRKLKDNASITTLLNNIADVLLSQERPAEALPLLEEGAQLSKAGEFWRLYPYLLFNQGRAYTSLGCADDALEPLQEALSYAKKNQDPYLEAWVEQALAEVLITKKQPTQAQEHVVASLSIAVKTQNTPLALDNLLLLAKMNLSIRPDFATNLLSYVYEHPKALEIDRLSAKKLLSDSKKIAPRSFQEDLTDILSYISEQLELDYIFDV